MQKELRSRAVKLVRLPLARPLTLSCPLSRGEGAWCPFREHLQWCFAHQNTPPPQDSTVGLCVKWRTCDRQPIQIWENEELSSAGGRRGGVFHGKACLLIHKHDHFTPTREIKRHVRALARHHSEGWKLQGPSPSTCDWVQPCDCLRVNRRIL